MKDYCHDDDVQQQQKVIVANIAMKTTSSSSSQSSSTTTNRRYVKSTDNYVDSKSFHRNNNNNNNVNNNDNISIVGTNSDNNKNYVVDDDAFVYDKIIDLARQIGLFYYQITKSFRLHPPAIRLVTYTISMILIIISFYSFSYLTTYQNTNNKNKGYNHSHIIQRPMSNRTNINNIKNNMENYNQFKTWEKEQFNIHEKNEKKADKIYGHDNNNTHILSLIDLPDLITDLGWDINQYYNTNNSTNQSQQQPRIVTIHNINEFNSKKYNVWNIIHRTGLQIDEYVYNVLPNWEHVQQLYYTKTNLNISSTSAPSTSTTNTTNLNNNDSIIHHNNTHHEEEINNSNNHDNDSRKDNDAQHNTDTEEKNEKNNNNDRPIIIGMDTCHIFRQNIQLNDRYIGVAGQMNTGTNALANLLSSNIYIPYDHHAVEDNKYHFNNKNKNHKNHKNQRKNDNNKNHANNNDYNGNHNGSGILSTVPWYKHGWISLRYQYNYQEPNEHKNVLPIVIIRDPYFWMNSMCQSPYTLKWNISHEHCPNLINNINDLNNTKKSIHVSLRWGRSFIRTWSSLVHLWSSWYREYYEAGNIMNYNNVNSKDDNNNDGMKTTSTNNKKNMKYMNYFDKSTPTRTTLKEVADDQNSQIIPRLMIRFEDMLFYPEFVVNEIRRCVGAKWIHDDDNNTTTINQTTTTKASNHNYYGNRNNDDDATSAGDNDNDSYDYYTNFVHAAAPSKTHPYFEQFKKHQSGFISALIKYGSDIDVDINDNNHNENATNKKRRLRRIRNMTNADIAFAFKYLDSTLLEIFQYNHPQTTTSS